MCACHNTTGDGGGGTVCGCIGCVFFFFSLVAAVSCACTSGCAAGGSCLKGGFSCDYWLKTSPAFTCDNLEHDHGYDACCYFVRCLCCCCCCCGGGDRFVLSTSLTAVVVVVVVVTTTTTTAAFVVATARVNPRTQSRIRLRSCACAFVSRCRGYRCNCWQCLCGEQGPGDINIVVDETTTQPLTCTWWDCASK